MRRTTVFVLVAVSGLLAGCLGQTRAEDPARNADAKDVTLTIIANAVSGGKNARGADWITNWVIPRFTEAQKAKGVNATVKFEQSGTADEAFKTKVALDFKTGGGGDVVELDGIWLGEFVQAGQVKPLDDLVGRSDVDAWDGWRQIPGAVRGHGEFEGKRYGVPMGTDGRVLFYNKKLFASAGLPADWQPRSWDELLSAATALKKLPGVTPIQLNAGSAMGEATTMQGVLPTLVGTGKPIHDNGKWQGATRLSQVTRDIVTIVTAFTIAHSTTLALAVTGTVHLPTQPIEVAIAASIAVAAGLNLLPRLSRLRLPLAFGFGFVHGFGFANALGEIDAGGTTLLPLLAGFNIGVEIAQLTIVALVLPLIFYARGTRWYANGVMPLGSCALGAAGVVWLLQRI